MAYIAKNKRRPWNPKPKPRPKTNVNWSNDKWYVSKEWRAIRNEYIENNPLCERCQTKGKVKSAYAVDHIVPIADGGSRSDTNNLQSLCKHCHMIKTANDVNKRNKQNKNGN